MALAALLAPLIGRRVQPPLELLDRYPELAGVQWRRGGVLPRVAGWCLAQHSVAAVTLWNVVFLGPRARPTAELLLHELAHVRQFEASLGFPLLYLWETVRRGYYQNRFEVDARMFAAARLHQSSTLSSP